MCAGPPPDALSLRNSTLLVPRIVSFNINDLSYYSTSPSGRARYFKIASCLRGLSDRNDIICIQETGLYPSEQLALSNSFPSCKIGRSSLKGGVAGVMTVEGPAITDRYSVSTLPLPLALNGFVLVRRYFPKDPFSGYQAFQCVNLYLYTGVGKEEKQTEMAQLLLKIPNDVPTFLCGDFNFVTQREDTSSADGLPSGKFLDLWHSVLSHLGVGEVPSQEHTRFKFCKEQHRIQSARLDRHYIPVSLFSVPIISPMVVTSNRKVLYPPQGTKSSKECFTDHLPVELLFSSTVVRDQGYSHIPQWIADSPDFAVKVREFWDKTPIAKSPFRALLGLKSIFKRAANFIRTFNLQQKSAFHTLSVQIKMLKLITAPKQKNVFIAEHLNLNPSLHGLVSLTQGRWMDKGLTAAISCSLATISPSQSTCKPTVNHQSIKDLVPRTKCRLGGLREREEEEITTSHDSMANIAAAFWGRTWKRRSPGTTEEERKDWLHWYTKKVKLDLICKPQLDDVRRAITSPKNTSPGPDGIPFAAWRATVDIAAPILFRVLTALMDGERPPSGFNHGLLFLLPKKNTHTISDTRPLSVTNTDNRILARVMSGAIMPGVKDMIHPSQKGFLWDVQGTDHVTDLNSIFMESVINKKDKYVFFLDTAKAFDSIDHTWILDVLDKAGFPLWFRNFFLASIADVEVSPFFGSPTTVKILIERGVKQGCPLSPLLFLLAYDPLLEDLGSMDELEVFGFADDVAVAFNQMAEIDHFLKRIDAFAAISGLGRNPSKSGIVSSKGRLSDPRCAEYLRNCRWPDLKMLDMVTYLGLPFGADITLEDVFNGPIAKMKDRLRLLAPVLSHLPLHKKIMIVNTYIVSLFSYACLFFVLPTELWTKIKEAIRLAVTPFNGGAYPYEALVCGGLQLGLKPALKDVWAFGLSLLAVRSPQFPMNGVTPRFVDIRSSMSIVQHRNSAAYDLWCYLPDQRKSTSPSSAKVYTIFVDGYFSPIAAAKWNLKLSAHLGAPNTFPTISSNCLLGRTIPSYLRAFFFSFLSNALPTARRRRHAMGLTKAQVDKCIYCGVGEDSIRHLFNDCASINQVAIVFFGLIRLPLSFAPVSLRAAFLADSLPSPIATRVVSAILATTFAAWSFRDRARAPMVDRGKDWVIKRVVNLSLTLFLSMAPEKSSADKKRKGDRERPHFH